MEDDDPRMDPQLHGDVADFVCLEHEALVSVWFLVLIHQLETLKKKTAGDWCFQRREWKASQAW